MALSIAIMRFNDVLYAKLGTWETKEDLSQWLYEAHGFDDEREEIITFSIYRGDDKENILEAINETSVNTDELEKLISFAFQLGLAFKP